MAIPIEANASEIGLNQRARKEKFRNEHHLPTYLSIYLSIHLDARYIDRAISRFIETAIDFTSSGFTIRQPCCIFYPNRLVE